MERIVLFNISEPVIFEKNSRINRSSQLALELSEQGNEVIWVTSSFSHISKRQLSDKEKLHPKNIHMKFLKSLSYKKNISLVRFFNNFFLAIQGFLY